MRTQTLVLAASMAMTSAASAATPNDPQFMASRAHLEQIQAPQGWETTTGSRAVVLAVIDGGVDLDHPDLEDNIWVNTREIIDGKDNDNNGFIDDVHGWDFLDGDNDPTPNTSREFSLPGIHHGTIVAGLAGAVGENGVNSTGVAWRVSIMPLRALGSNGDGLVLHAIQAIDYAVQNGAHIINLSFSGEQPSLSLTEALERTRSAGVLVVAAAGNDDAHTLLGRDLNFHPKYPICSDRWLPYQLVLGVSAVDSTDRLASFANYGSCVDVVAPGVGLPSTLLYDTSDDRFALSFGGKASGTSMAAPLVSGALSLIKAAHLDWTAERLLSVILESVDPIDQLNPGYAGEIGRGRVNISRAIGEVKNAPPTPHASVERGEARVVVGTATSGRELRFFKTDGTHTGGFYALPDVRAGVALAAGDVDDNGSIEIVVAASSKGNGIVWMFDTFGNLVSVFNAFGREARGMQVTLGDIHGDGILEIIVTSTTGKSRVRIFSHKGELLREIALPVTKKYTGGHALAAGDVDGDGKAEIAVSPLGRAMPIVRIYNGDGSERSSFLIGAPRPAPGARLAIGNIDGKKGGEIIVAPAGGAPSVVQGFTPEGHLVASFEAFPARLVGGLFVSVGDLEGDGEDEIIVGAGAGGGPQIKIFTRLGELKGSFFAFDQSVRTGVVAALYRE